MPDSFKSHPWCEKCEHCEYIGDGYHVCNQYDDVTVVLLGYEDVEPTDQYLSCRGNMFSPRKEL